MSQAESLRLLYQAPPRLGKAYAVFGHLNLS
jgi:hypothetical protein